MTADPVDLHALAAAKFSDTVIRGLVAEARLPPIISMPEFAEGVRFAALDYWVGGGPLKRGDT